MFATKIIISKYYSFKYIKTPLTVCTKDSVSRLCQRPERIIIFLFFTEALAFS